MLGLCLFNIFPFGALLDSLHSKTKLINLVACMCEANGFF